MPVQLLVSLLVNAALSLSVPRFEELVIDDGVAIGYGLAIGDVDGDGKPDILLADKKQFVWYRNGDWKRFVMVDNLTVADNVCLAARDIDGDGKVEVAVGAQWNPGETSDTTASGSVHYLIRPGDPTQLWTPVTLHHEPTIHRMRWIKTGPNQFQLIVLPLHGRGNKGGEGNGVKVMAYEMPGSNGSQWKYHLIDESMHLTHNMDVVVDGSRELLYFGGKEGIKLLQFDKGSWKPATWFVQGYSFGEVRKGSLAGGKQFVTGIEPMHGTTLSLYPLDSPEKRSVLEEDFNQGHVLATGDLMGIGQDQIVAGWREPNKGKKVGIKIYVPDSDGSDWAAYWIDENTMAGEDVRLADLNGDGKIDIVAAGRSTHNLKIYWNKN